MLQSNGTRAIAARGRSRDLSNLNNASLMHAYFQNFALLMQRLGTGTYDGIAGFGKTAIVHVEPDSLGLCRAGGARHRQLLRLLHRPGQQSGSAEGGGGRLGLRSAWRPTPTPIRASTGRLLHLRDLYAPNVLLAFHVSDWATGTDIGSNTSATLDAAALGRRRVASPPRAASPACRRRQGLRPALQRCE